MIKAHVQHGEAGSISVGDLQEQLQQAQALIAQYQPCGIYNCDETGLFWKMVPDRSLSTLRLPGTKKEKHRISFHFCCNADRSHKLPLWFIGSAKIQGALDRLISISIA